MQLTAQVEERISKCEEILSQNPESLVFAALADAYRKKGDLSRAFHTCSQGLKLHPTYGPGHLVMARINLERGMYTEAEKELASAEQSDGRTRATELLLAQILIKRDQPKEARMGLDLLTVQDRVRISKVVDLKDGVYYLKSLPGVMGALVVEEDGVVIESKLGPNLGADIIGAITARIIGCVNPGMSGIEFGQYRHIWIDTVKFGLWIAIFKERALVLCYAPEANVGALRLRANELLDHLSANL
jgi:predicted regulator of Ras-like GTPase activity (Roadblock/LC7/MglB family)/predicted Zn-dependent protease